MEYETKKRSVLKAISWRVCATVTTAVIVYIFTGEFALAITVGVLEVFAKMALYFFHERLWHNIHFGKREIPSFVVWITGLPASNKKALGDAIHAELKKMRLKTERLDSRDIRPLFPEVGFAPEEVDSHVRRAGHLMAMLERNGVCAIFSSVSPYARSREFARSLATNFVEIHMKSTVEACERRDHEGHYAKARAGEYQFFPGISATYETPGRAELVVDADHEEVDAAAKRVLRYLKQNVMYSS